MQKIDPKQVFSLIAADRPLLSLLITVIFVGLICSLIVAFNIHPSDVTVYSRYTAFGEAHFYKSHWQYLLLFVVFNIMVASVHAWMMTKLHRIERRQTAVLFGWIGIVIIVAATVYALSVIQLGQAA